MIDLGGDVTGNGISKLVFTILSAVAENERDRIRERVRETRSVTGLRSGCTTVARGHSDLMLTATPPWLGQPDAPFTTASSSTSLMRQLRLLRVTWRMPRASSEDTPR
jgi:hypothetical protein